MSWAEAELGGARWGDQRLTKRLVKLTEALAAAPTASLPAACRGWAETQAAYRLLDNEALDWRELLQPHWACSEQRMGDYERVLCIQDTTELDFTGVAFRTQPGTAELGRLSHEARRGFYVHPTLAVSATGVALGVLDAWRWARAPRGEATPKESSRWSEGYERVAELAARLPETRLVYVADREADSRELIETAARYDHAADDLIRADHDRRLARGGKLGSSFEPIEPLGTVPFELPAQPGRAARTVTQQLSVQRLTLADQGQGEHAVTAILARESAPPEGVEPIEWRLLTNRPITTLAQAAACIDDYRQRWRVENARPVLSCRPLPAGRPGVACVFRRGRAHRHVRAGMRRGGSGCGASTQARDPRHPTAPRPAHAGPGGRRGHRSTR